MKRNQFLDYAKGQLILLVTIGHAIQFAVYQEGEGFWGDPIFKAIYIFHMPLFMGISGYLAYSGLQKLEFLKFTLGKLKTYLVPILAWATTHTLAKCLIEGWPHPYEFGAELLAEFFGIRLWFIWVLFGCLILTAAIKMIGRRFWMIYAASTLAVLFLPEVGDFIVLKVSVLSDRIRAGSFRHRGNHPMEKMDRRNLVGFDGPWLCSMDAGDLRLQFRYGPFRRQFGECRSPVFDRTFRLGAGGFSFRVPLLEVLEPAAGKSRVAGQ